MSESDPAFKFFKVAKILKEVADLRGRNEFRLPLQRFAASELPPEDIIEVLWQLQNKADVLSVSKLIIKNAGLCDDLFLYGNLVDVSPDGHYLRGNSLFDQSYQYNPKDEISLKIKPEVLKKLYLGLATEATVKNGAQTTAHTLPKFPYKLADNFNWSHITIKFLDGHRVDIVYKDIKLRTSYSEMGFQNKTTSNPNKLWKFLELLSHNGGETNSALLNKMNNEDRNQLKSWKAQLVNGLKVYFGFNDDPFPFEYGERLYKLKLNLIPSEGQIKHSVKEEEEIGIMEGAPDLS